MFNDTATTEIYTLSRPNALPISPARAGAPRLVLRRRDLRRAAPLADRARRGPVSFRRAGLDRRLPEYGLRSDEHTSELQSRQHLVCRLLFEKKQHLHDETHEAHG